MFYVVRARRNGVLYKERRFEQEEEPQARALATEWATPSEGLPEMHHIQVIQIDTPRAKVDEQVILVEMMRGAELAS